MTDKEKLKELLQQFGIINFVETETTIDIESGICEKVDGYAGFAVNFCFDEMGTFERLGIWE